MFVSIISQLKKKKKKGIIVPLPRPKKLCNGQTTSLYLNSLKENLIWHVHLNTPFLRQT